MQISFVGSLSLLQNRQKHPFDQPEKRQFCIFFQTNSLMLRFQRGLLIVMQKQEQQYCEIRSHVVNSTQPSHKIRCISLALDQTAVFVERDFRKKDYLVHTSLREGRTLWRYKLPKTVSQFTMVSSREVIIENHQSNAIELISLKSHSVTKIHHNFAVHNPKHIFFFPFCATQLLCLMEVLPKDFKLTYFSLAGWAGETVAQVSPLGTKSYFCEAPAFQVNNHSKMGWAKESSEEEYEFGFFDLQKQPKGREQSIRVAKENKITGWKFTSMNVVWEIAEDQFLVFLWEEKGKKENRGFKVVNCSKGNGSIELMETKICETQKTFRFSQAYFRKSIGLSSVVMVHLSTCYYDIHDFDGVTTFEHYLFINLQWEQILHIETFPKGRVAKLGWDNSVLLQMEEKEDEREVRVTIKRFPMEMKPAYLQMLLHFNEDFDDDLLQDSISSLF